MTRSKYFWIVVGILLAMFVIPWVMGAISSKKAA